MGKRTALYDSHVASKAKIVDFSGWDMPLHYGSQLDEHHQVRKHAGMFDVSHMGIVDLSGSDARKFLRHLLANDVDRIPEGKAIYTCMLNEQGGVIDDLIVYKITTDSYRAVINAARREKDVQWIQSHIKNQHITFSERDDLAMIAVQGPEVKDKIGQALEIDNNIIASLKPFSFLIANDWFIARTGYTGEDGFELILPASKTAMLWQTLLSLGIKPCGLGARDTLRLEAGLNLYGNDMDETVTPLESNLSWTIAFDPQDRDFIGREALEKQRQEGIKARLVGLVLQGPGIMRNHQKVLVNEEKGEVTSGSYSPTLEISIALARVPSDIGDTCLVQIRDKAVPAQVIKPPFVRHGKKMF